MKLGKAYDVNVTSGHREDKGDDPVSRLQEEANWSSFTNSWSRRIRGGAPWARTFLIVCIWTLLIASIVGAVITIASSQ